MVEEPALPAPAVATPVWDACPPGRGGQQGRCDAAAPPSRIPGLATFAPAATKPADPVMLATPAVGIKVDPLDVRDRRVAAQ